MLKCLPFPSPVGHVLCCTQYASKFGKLSRLEKVSFHSNPKERQCQRMLKLPHNCTVSHASKIMRKILQARLQQYVNRKLPDIQAIFRKARGTRDQIANIHWVICLETTPKNSFFAVTDRTDAPKAEGQR